MKTPKKYWLEIILENEAKRIGISIAKWFNYLSRIPRKKNDKMDKIAYLLELGSFVLLLSAILMRR